MKEENKPKNEKFKVLDMHKRDGDDQKPFTMWQGEKVFMEIMPQGDDFQVVFFMLCKHETPFGEVEHPKTLTGYLMERRWWHKLFGVSDERLVDKAVERAKLRWERVKANTENFDRIREKHGLEIKKP